MQFGSDLLQILCPENPDHVLETITDEQYEKDHFLPYWAEHWPSTDIFKTFLLSKLDQFSRGKICELGSGLGVIGSFMSRRSEFYISSDISPISCKYAFRNVQNNDGNPVVVCFDWRYPPFNIKFDYIIGSDVLYELRWIESVTHFLEQHLAPNGKAYFADPCRRFWTTFQDNLRNSGNFKVEKVHEAESLNKKSIIQIIEVERA